MPTPKNDLAILSFDAAVQENLDDLKSKYEKYFPSESFSSDVCGGPSVDLSLNNSFASMMMERFFRSPLHNPSTPFFLSYNLSKSAVQHQKNGNMDKAWFLLSKARYFAGIADASLFGTERFLDEAVNAHANKGRESRRAKNLMAKKEAARLIREEAAKICTKSNGTWKGWRSRQEAAKAIASDLWLFVSSAENRISLKEDGLSHRVYVWMNADDEIRSAFNETCAEDAQYTPKKHRSWDWG